MQYYLTSIARFIKNEVLKFDVNLNEIQKIKLEFDEKIKWDKFPASNVLVHLLEELGEIGRYINFEEGYKKENSGNNPNINKDELKREFAQVFTLFLQLANHYKIDLGEAFKAELEITKKRFKK